jgi:hypothetical protein
VRSINLTIFLADSHCLQNRNFANIFAFFKAKKIITGEPDANVRVHVPGIVVRVDAPRPGMNAVVPVPASH